MRDDRGASLVLIACLQPTVTIIFAVLCKPTIFYYRHPHHHHSKKIELLNLLIMENWWSSSSSSVPAKCWIGADDYCFVDCDEKKMTMGLEKN